MRLILIGFLLFGTSLLWASDEIWKLGDSYFSLFRNEEKNLLYSKFCEEKKCEAKEILSKVSLKKLKKNSLRGGKNPGAVLCHEQTQGRVIFLRDMDGNDNSFCEFADKSLVSSSTLDFYARKNDEK